MAPLAPALAACGDPLLDGDDPGPPTLVLDARVLGLDQTDSDRDARAAIIWTSPLTLLERFEKHEVTSIPHDVGDFQFQIFGQPDHHIVDVVTTGDDPAAIALGFFAVLDAGEWPFMLGAELDRSVRGAAADHYLLWVHRPAELTRVDAAGADDTARRVRDLVVNPDALIEGMNLVVGLCRPGRPSQLLVVPPERVTISARSTIAAGACLDVFWGDWR